MRAHDETRRTRTWAERDITRHHLGFLGVLGDGLQRKSPVAHYRLEDEEGRGGRGRPSGIPARRYGKNPDSPSTARAGADPNPIAGYREETTGSRAGDGGGGMTRGKQKIDAQRRNAERNQKSKGSQLEARAEGLKVVCPICKVQLANEKQLIDHYGSKHPKEKPPSASNA